MVETISAGLQISTTILEITGVEFLSSTFFFWRKKPIAAKTAIIVICLSTVIAPTITPFPAGFQYQIKPKNALCDYILSRQIIIDTKFMNICRKLRIIL